MRSEKYLRGLLFIGLVSLAACAPIAARMSEPLASASTPADHEALAAYYEHKAKELTRQAEVSRHQARVYGVFPYGAPKSTVTFAQRTTPSPSVWRRRQRAVWVLRGSIARRRR